MFKKTEDTIKLMQSLVEDLEDLITNMKVGYKDIIDDQKKEINLLVKENEILRRANLDKKEGIIYQHNWPTYSERHNKKEE